MKNQIYEDSSGASLAELGNGILFIYKVASIFLLVTTGIHRLFTVRISNRQNKESKLMQNKVNGAG